MTSYTSEISRISSSSQDTEDGEGLVRGVAKPKPAIKSARIESESMEPKRTPVVKWKMDDTFDSGEA
eukprot:scaffold457532_cov114-Attheya_sp.AAC.1